MGKYPWSDQQDQRREDRRPIPKPKTPIKPSTKPIPKKSKKRAEDDKVYFALRDLHLKLHPECQIPIEGICAGIATDLHHPKGRVGKLYTDASLFLSACRPCHSYVELHPDIAKELGYSLSRLD
jgi:hypothetical protein